MDECWIPESLYIGLQDLEKTVKEVQSLLEDQQYPDASNEHPLMSEAGENILVENHASVFHGTHLVILEIQQIAMACIKQGRQGAAVPPLDLMLHEWISGCSDNVLRIKKCIRPLKETEDSKLVEEADNLGDEWLLLENTNGNGRDSDDDSESSTLGAEGDHPSESTSGKLFDTADLSHEFTSLKDRTTHIADFIPILKSQIDEFLAQNVSYTPVPNSSTEERIRGDGKYPLSSVPSGQGASLASLRTLLYRVSDELKVCQRQLGSLSFSRPLSVDVMADVNGLKAAADVSIKLLAESLSNNASEWIESMLAGKLSFHEFSTLDQEELQEFLHGIRQMNGQLSHAVRERARRGIVGLDAVDVEVMELSIWTQRVQGLNWMLGRRDLT